MRSKPPNLNEMLRSAFQAQVDFGLGEMIVKPVPSPPPEENWAEGIKMVRKINPMSDLFASTEPPSTAPQFESLEQHYQHICHCQFCPLGQTRTKFVYGVGNPNADLMFIGEAPGRDEDLQGEPFVGRAGQLLDKILAAMNLSRQEVYIANILKCRPPENRDPLPEEMAQCFPHLCEQIHLIRPKLIGALGRIAAQMLLQTKAPLGRLRGQWHQFEGIPTLVTYHPAALLRAPMYKKDTWEDMQTILARLKGQA